MLHYILALIWSVYFVFLSLSLSCSIPPTLWLLPVCCRYAVVFFPNAGKKHTPAQRDEKAPPSSSFSSSLFISFSKLPLPLLLFVFLHSSFFVRYVSFHPSFPKLFLLSSFLYSCFFSLSEDLSHFWLTRPQVASYCCQQSQHAPGLWNTQQWASKVLFRSLYWLLWLGKSQRVGLYDTDR